jgi:hypothetical protein
MPIPPWDAVMRISLKRWIARHKLPGRRARKRARLFAACLTVGLASAWGSTATAVTVHLSVTPTQTLTDAYVVYILKNSSSLADFPLGTIPGGETTIFDTDFPFLSAEDFSPLPPGEYFEPGYVVIGVHGPEENPGFSFAFANDAPITSGDTWETLFDNSGGEVSEADVVANYRLSVDGAKNLTIAFWELLVVPFGQPSTMIDFSAATFGGTAIAYVPEPSTWVLACTAAGVFAFGNWRRNRG